MTVHSFETTTTIDGSTWRDIQKHLCVGNKWETNKKGLTVYWGLANKGIIIICQMANYNNHNHKGYYLKYIISGRRVLENDNYVDLFDSSDFSKLKEAVNDNLDRVCPSLPHLGKCSLSRMDFCINFKLGSPEQVEAYLSTLKRARIPKFMKRVEFKDEIAHRKVPGKHEFTVSHEAEDNLTISFYDKSKQMELQTQKGYKYPEKALECSDSILRMEFRCKIKKLVELKKKYNSYSIKEFFLNADEIADFLFRKYLPQLFGTGKVMTFEKASKKLQESSLDKKEKDHCIDLIKRITRCRSAEKGIREYQSIHPEESITHIEGILTNLGINYVTIARETVKELPNETFSTPLELYESYQRRKR